MTAGDIRSADWHLGADGERYPPEPWYLGGEFVVGVFVVPQAQVPAEILDGPGRPLRLRGRVIIGVAAVHYSAGGVLAYEELLVAVAGRDGWRPRVTIPWIVVTSPASRTGGRELWGIPKELTAARRVRGSRSAEITFTEAGVEARLSRWWIPGVGNLPLPTLQHSAGQRITSHNRIAGRLRPAKVSWTFGPELAWLSGARQLLGVAIADAAVTFGMRVRRRPR